MRVSSRGHETTWRFALECVRRPHCLVCMIRFGGFAESQPHAAHKAAGDVERVAPDESGVLRSSFATEPSAASMGSV